MTARSVSELIDRARLLAERAAGRGSRHILGITGAPGSGKTTLAHDIVGQLGPELAVLVPMDGFHLANATLIGWQRRDRKGAWDTFDADGYVHLLGRLRERTGEVVHAPDFVRDLDESIGSAIPVHRQVPLVVTEGNYLLSGRGSWAEVAPLLDESWYLQVADGTRQERLAARHQQHGMSPSQAATWAASTDQNNAVVVAEGRERADLVITLG